MCNELIYRRLNLGGCLHKEEWMGDRERMGQRMKEVGNSMMKHWSSTTQSECKFCLNLVSGRDGQG